MSTTPGNALALLAELERKVAALERASVRVRTDYRDSAGVLRVRVGEIDGTGRYGVRVWNSAGVLVHDLTST
jgi:hypothetical protein